jgi:uncharacterized membrane protein
MPFHLIPLRKRDKITPQSLPIIADEAIKDEDLTTEEEREVNARIITPTEIIEKLKPVEARGILGSISYWLSELMTEYRYKAVGFFIVFVFLWIILNLNATAMFFQNTFGTHPAILEFDPFPHKLLTFIISFAGAILTQIILIYQKKDDALDKERVKSILQIAWQNQSQLGLIKERQLALTRKIDELAKTQYKLLDFVTLLLNTVSEETSNEEGPVKKK